MCAFLVPVRGLLMLDLAVSTDGMPADSAVSFRVARSRPPEGARLIDADGWTLRNATGCRTAHSEHTIAMADDGAEVLTLPR